MPCFRALSFNPTLPHEKRPRLDKSRGRFTLSSRPPSLTDSEASKCRNQLRHAQAVPLEATLTSLDGPASPLPFLAPESAQPEGRW